MSPAPDIKNGLVTAVEGGKVRLTMVSDGEEVGTVDVGTSMVGGIVAQILSSAIAAHQQSGKPLPDHTQDNSEWFALVPSSFGLGPCHIPGHTSVIFLFGEAQIGFALSTEQAHALGEALLASTASEKSPQ